jgi:large subunit ribosomal protein L28
MKTNNSIRRTHCPVTGKSVLFGNRRSKALNATRHMQKPNLQVLRVKGEDGVTFKIKVSAKGLRTLRKVNGSTVLNSQGNV